LQVDLQFNAATTPWPVLRDAAHAADDAGYGALWVFDHLAGLSVNGTSMLEAFTLLGALAASTERVALGSLVINVAHREPAITAVGAASVQAIADRPVFLGLGAGASPDSPWAAELRAAGQPVEPSVERRHARVEAVIAACRSMWSPEREAALATFPQPLAPPQIHVGASGRALARLAGRLADGLNVPWAHPRRDELFAAAAAVDRLVPSPLVLTTYAAFDESWLDRGHPQRLGMAAAGIERLILLVRHPDPVVLAATAPDLD
jgi:alkanesulfonate monooxygenase SsuD/methylene tetrahydromethanopterin reductase-like flavin-dependent oxidoreductase (luciferase family)